MMKRAAVAAMVLVCFLLDARPRDERRPDVVGIVYRTTEKAEVELDRYRSVDGVVVATFKDGRFACSIYPDTLLRWPPWPPGAAERCFAAYANLKAELNR